MEEFAMIVVCMAFPSAFCLLLAMGDVIMDILYFIFPTLGRMEAEEIERFERWQEEE